MRANIIIIKPSIIIFFFVSFFMCISAIYFVSTKEAALKKSYARVLNFFFFGLFNVINDRCALTRICIKITMKQIRIYRAPSAVSSQATCLHLNGSQRAAHLKRAF